MTQYHDLTITSKHIPRYCPNVGDKRFAYETEQDRTLLLHALAHIPDALLTCTDLRNLATQPQTKNRELTWYYYWKNYDSTGQKLEPPISIYSHGSYHVSYNTDTKLYTTGLLWDENKIHIDDGRVSSYAINFPTQKELLTFLKQAHEEGIACWKEVIEKDRHMRNAENKWQNEFIKRTFEEMP